MYVSNGIKLYHANKHFTVIVLLEYTDLFTMCTNIMLGKDCFVNIIVNALPSSQLILLLYVRLLSLPPRYLSVKLKIIHSFIERIRVSNARTMEFCILILLGDE